MLNKHLTTGILLALSLAGCTASLPEGTLNEPQAPLGEIAESSTYDLNAMSGLVEEANGGLLASMALVDNNPVKISNPSDLTLWIKGNGVSIQAKSLATSEDSDGFYDRVQVSSGFGWVSTPIEIPEGQTSTVSVALGGRGGVRVSVVAPTGGAVYATTALGVNGPTRASLQFAKPADGVRGALLVVASITNDEEIHVGGARVDSPVVQPPAPVVVSAPAAVSSVSPWGAGQPVTTAIKFTFNAPVDPQSLSVTTTPSVSLAAPIWYNNNQHVVLQPSSALQFGTTYTVKLSAKNAAGAAVTGALTQYQFSTVALVAPTPPPAPSPSPAPSPQAGEGLRNAKKYGIELYAANAAQFFADLDKWAATPIDVLIMGRWAAGYPVEKTRVEKLRQAGKKVIGYLAAGHTQTFEPYWQSAWGTQPPFGVVKDPYWNMWAVQQNHPEWHKAMRVGLDHAIAHGFDGVFLDVITPYWTPGYPGDRTELQKDTLDMLAMMRNHLASVGRPDFIIVTNGGNETLNVTSRSAYGNKRFADLVDSMLLESLSSTSYNNIDNDKMATVRTQILIANAKQFMTQSGGKPVMGLNSTVTDSSVLFNRTYPDMTNNGLLAYTAPGNYNTYRAPK